MFLKIASCIIGLFSCCGCWMGVFGLLPQRFPWIWAPSGESTNLIFWNPLSLYCALKLDLTPIYCSPLPDDTMWLIHHRKTILQPEKIVDLHDGPNIFDICLQFQFCICIDMRDDLDVSFGEKQPSIFIVVSQPMSFCICLLTRHLGEDFDLPPSILRPCLDFVSLDSTWQPDIDGNPLVPNVTPII